MELLVNAITGRPLLELLLAREGIETPHLPVDRSRLAFEEFLAIPAEHEDMGGCFQSEVVSEGEDGAVFGCGLFRQVTDPSSGFDPEEKLTRLIGLWWSSNLAEAGNLRTMQIWAADCGSRPEFWDRVEATPEWQFLIGRTPEEAGVVADEYGQFARPRHPQAEG